MATSSCLWPVIGNHRMARRKVPLPPDEMLDQLRDDLRWRPPPRPRDATSIGTLLSSLMARKGYSQVETASAREDAWRAAVGDELFAKTRPGDVKRGVFEIHVANSLLLQELTFRKAALLQDLKKRLPDHKIRDLRFRVSAVGNS